MKILLTAINAKYIHSNLAVYSLKAYANRNDEVSICEFTINNLVEEILDGIYMRKPDILAFSCYIWNVEYVKKLVIEIKKLLPNVKIWLGGPEAFYNSKNLLEELKNVDLIMKGEGEITFKELADFYCPLSYEKYNKKYISNPELEEKLLAKLKGVDYRKCDGTIGENPYREAMDMSTIPFPYGDMKDFENKIIYYESSRGCPFSCSYCLSSVEKQLRFRDVELVKKELKFFIDNNVPQVKFVDRTFNCKKNHAMELWTFILENDNGVTNFHFEIAADLIDEEELELISKMRPGLIQLEIGVQSTNLTTINEIHRKMDLSKLTYVVNKINSFKNTLQHLDLIAGLPYENLDSFINSFNDVYKLHPSELQLGFLKVLSGSYMFDKKDDYGIKYKDYPPYEVLSTNWISYDNVLLLKGVEEMVEVYYNSGQFIISLNYLQKYFDTPFEMFYELNKYYEVHYNKSMKHSRISRYFIMLEFFTWYIENNYEDVNNENEAKEKLLETMKNSMTIDIYLRENSKARPEFASDLSEYRCIIKEAARGLNLSKSQHIEILSQKMLEEIKFNNLIETQIISTEYVLNSGDFCEEMDKLTKRMPNPCFVIFDYEERSIITNQSKVLIWKVKYGKKEC